jgi:hypothetical protein
MVEVAISIAALGWSIMMTTNFELVPKLEAQKHKAMVPSSCFVLPFASTLRLTRSSASNPMAGTVAHGRSIIFQCNSNDIKGLVHSEDLPCYPQFMIRVASDRVGRSLVPAYHHHGCDAKWQD